jgi:sortase (surface protein transpeptidase)
VILTGGPPQANAVLSVPARAGLVAGPGIPGPDVPGAATVDCFLVPCDQPALTGTPTVLRIPRLAVTTTLESLVLDGARQLQPPHDYGRAGWWIQGVVPGDVGAAVIAGHVDSAKSGPAIFYNLHTLAAGDTVEVDRGGRTVVFSVTAVERYPKDGFPTDRVYQPTPDAELRLITCGGEFDRSRLSYRDNVVVYAVRVPA